MCWTSIWFVTQSYTACNENNFSLASGQSVTRNIGASGVWVFCKGVKLTGNSSLTLGPGTFIVDGGGFDVTSGSVTATGGTTIILTTKALRQTLRHRRYYKRPYPHNRSGLGMR